VRSAAAIARDVLAGRVRAADVIADTLATIDARDPSINAFTTRLDDEARHAAASIDLAVAAGREPGPLAGVPFAVKNLYDIQGVTTIAGARINERRRPAAADATLVRRLRQSGAVLVGALNMDAYAYGFTTENTHYGATHNPHDTQCTAGGSSGGSAAALAAGMVPLTLGSDTNGSIRVPASLCGIFGLKPTFGRLSRTGSMPFVHDLDVLGPFASTTSDLALAYDAMRGYDSTDAACAEMESPPLMPLISKGADDLRIAVADGYFAAPLAWEAREAVTQAANLLGAHRHMTLPEAERARAAAFVLTASTAGSLYLPQLRRGADDFEPLSRDRLMAGALVPASWVHAAQRFRRWYHDRLLELFTKVDVILAPSTPCCAFPLGTETLDIEGVRLAARANLGMYTQPLSCIGLPVAAVPIEIGSRLPIGIQVVAAPWREDICLRVAAALEQHGIARARIA
jgi:AtzE family amidohydrolase